jgi:hypothetical protein
MSSAFQNNLLVLDTSGLNKAGPQFENGGLAKEDPAKDDEEKSRSFSQSFFDRYTDTNILPAEGKLEFPMDELKAIAGKEKTAEFVTKVPFTAKNDQDLEKMIPRGDIKEEGINGTDKFNRSNSFFNTDDRRKIQFKDVGPSIEVSS